MTFGLLFVPKNPLFFCEKCQYKTDNKKDYKKHLLTLKHSHGLLLDTNLSSEKSQKSQFICHCGRSYKYKQGLCKHIKTCEKSKETETLVKITNLFEEQIKENKELKDLLLEQNTKLMEIANEKGQCVIVNNTTNNTMNTTNNFNLQVFLKEKCKDALNIMDFAESIKMKLTDVDLVGQIGYTEGISQIFIRGLRELDICKRPIHCCDSKREIMYVKDKDAWEKENNEKNKIKRMIDYIAHKNIVQITEWVNQNPEAKDYDSKKHIEYVKILGESMGGKTDEESRKIYQKIIRNVAKHVMIEK